MKDKAKKFFFQTFLRTFALNSHISTDYTMKNKLECLHCVKGIMSGIQFDAPKSTAQFLTNGLLRFEMPM